MSTVKEVKDQSQKGLFGKPIWVCLLALIKVGLLSSPRHWRQGLYLQVWNKQQILLAALIFLSQVLYGNLGMHPREATRNCVSVYSSLYRPKLRPTQEGSEARGEFGQESLYPHVQITVSCTYIVIPLVK